MKILLSNHALQNLGGSETWTYTMYQELSKDHDVSVFTPRQNTLFPFMKRFQKAESYDLAIMNHGTTLKRLKDANIKRRILTSHGVIPGAEKPVDGADVYVSVSEEVQAKLAETGYESTVIRNPIDLEKFACTPRDRPKLKTALFLSNNPRNSMLRSLKEAAQNSGVKLIIGGRGNTIADTQGTMDSVEMVFGLGRSAYEAMSMERNVVIFDYNGADGVATTETLPMYRTSNCSGRYHKEKWDAYEIMEAFDSYDPERGASLREYIRENNNVVTIAEQYLCL
jgi:hypothetical protein